VTEHRQYSEDEIASALAMLRANGGNAKRTAKHLGISRTTLRQWAGLSPVRGKQVGPDLVEAHSMVLADKLDVLAQRLIDKVSDGLNDIPMEDSGDVRNLLVAGGITIEKASFARGGATSRTETTQIVYIQPNALHDLSIRVLDGDVKELMSGNETSPELG